MSGDKAAPQWMSDAAHEIFNRFIGTWSMDPVRDNRIVQVIMKFAPVADPAPAAPTNYDDNSLMYATPAMDYQHHLMNLLAVIHRDGGHYVADHGIEKAVEDAMNRVIEARADHSVAPNKPISKNGQDGEAQGERCPLADELELTDDLVKWLNDKEKGPYAGTITQKLWLKLTASVLATAAPSTLRVGRRKKIGRICAMTPTGKELEQARGLISDWEALGFVELSDGERQRAREQMLANFRADGQREVFERARKLMCGSCNAGIGLSPLSSLGRHTNGYHCHAYPLRAVFPQFSKPGEGQ